MIDWYLYQGLLINNKLVCIVVVHPAHISSVPVDPFALPACTHYTDPLRCPIFIPLEMSALVDEDGNDAFRDFAEDTVLVRIQMLQVRQTSRNYDCDYA